MLTNTLRLNFCYFKIIHILHPRYGPKIMGDILKVKQKNMRACIHEIIKLIIMKMKMKNRSHRYNINKPGSRHGHIHIKYKKCLSMMILIRTKQHLSNYLKLNSCKS